MRYYINYTLYYCVALAKYCPIIIGGILFLAWLILAKTATGAIIEIIIILLVACAIVFLIAQEEMTWIHTSDMVSLK